MKYYSSSFLRTTSGKNNKASELDNAFLCAEPRQEIM